MEASAGVKSRRCASLSLEQQGDAFGLVRCSERGALLGVGSSLSDQLREESSSAGVG